MNGNFIIYGENKEYNILITDVGGDKSKIINICNQELEQYLKIKSEWLCYQWTQATEPDENFTHLLFYFLGTKSRRL